MSAWPESVEAVAAYLRAAGAEARLEEFESATGTASEAARVVGCDPADIVKSLVFVCDGRPVLALVPGDRRADPAKIARATGAAEARVARADEVRAITGFEPGAVAPFPTSIEDVVMERTLLQHGVVWIGAGSSTHLARIGPTDLQELSGARTADLVQPR